MPTRHELHRLPLLTGIVAILLGLAMGSGLFASSLSGHDLVLFLPRSVWAAPQMQAIDAGEIRNVLLITSYHDGLNWTDDIVTAVRSVLLDPERNPLAANTELYVEYMDSKRFPITEAVQARWHAYLAEKYASIPLDAIVVSDNAAYDFLRHSAAELFPGTPIVFSAVNFFTDDDLAVDGADGVPLSERFTGVVAKVDFYSTIHAAVRMHPDARHMIVVNDITRTGQLLQLELEEVLDSFPTITFEMLLNPTLADLSGLRVLPNDTLVLLVLLDRDGEGRVYTYEQSINLLLTHTDRPIYGVWDFYLGHGLVGGMLTNATLQGEVAGEMAIRLLNGASIRDVPIVRDSPNRYMFDYDQLQRFGLSLHSLPDEGRTLGLAETLVLGRPAPPVQMYGSWIGMGLALVLLAVGFLLLQRNHLAKQAASDKALHMAHVALEDARATMEARVVERARPLERRTRQYQIATEVAREVAVGALGLRDAGSKEGAEGVSPLLDRATRLISEAFGFYHVAIFLVDEVGENALLRAASSPGGQAMVARGHRLRIAQPNRHGGEGIVGYVAGVGESRIALDVGRDSLWRDTAELNHTRSEMALPLQIEQSGGDGLKAWTIGVLDVQSLEPGAFRQDDVEALQIVADQLALAIQASRLFEESRRAVERLEERVGEHIRAPWYRTRVARAYGFDGVSVRRITELAAGDEAGADAASADLAPGLRERLEVPIPVRGEVVGTIVLERDVHTRPWLPEERALAEAIAVHAGLSLEGAQLLDESQIQAQRRQVLSDITSRMRETLDVDMILQTALREMGERLGIAGIEVRMRGGSND